MKKLFLLPLVMASAVAFSQVGINTITPDPSSILDIKSTNKGILIPRVALTGKTDVTTIPNPAHSLLIYNTANAGTSPNNVVEDNIYKFNTTTGLWQKLLDETTGIPGVSTVSNIIGFKSTGNDTTFLGADVGSTIRFIKYDDVRQTSSYANYDTATNELKILKTGYFSFNINFVVRGAFNGVLRVGVSKPYSGSFVYNGNASFAFLAQPNISVDSSTPAIINASGTLLLTAGQKVIFLSRYIDPAVNTLNVEAINYNRTLINSVIINYTEPQ
ncbi:hypothetical protein [Chryseobacterium sp. MEBOG07]|uniref:hypothetical protein n=1 Tax=Chryseobacterium sp. MEBOG07 TaxID=2879939 RepID=UPI001F423422|nr:hypothetical protein [Chryseobacterium sp. MEBOG07]UKB77665.1 hypothetical protein LF886_14330 [Chryseobacterium sp. MEBOG07]